MQISKNLIIIPPHPPGPSVTCFSKASWSGFADNISLMKAGSSSGLLPPPPVHIYLLMEAILFIYHWSPSCLSVYHWQLSCLFIICTYLVYLSIHCSHLVYLSIIVRQLVYQYIIGNHLVNLSIICNLLVYLSIIGRQLFIYLANYHWQHQQTQVCWYLNPAKIKGRKSSSSSDGCSQTSSSDGSLLLCAPWSNSKQMQVAKNHFIQCVLIS